MTELRLLKSGLTKPYRSTYEQRLIARDRRFDLVARQLCLNGAAHGKATHGVLCERCRISHRRTA